MMCPSNFSYFKNLIALVLSTYFVFQIYTAEAQTAVHCSEQSPVIGISLPAKPGQPLRIGETHISKAILYGRRPHILKIVNDLIDKESMFYDVTCNLLLTPPKDALSAVPTMSAPLKYHDLSCRKIVWYIPDPTEFASLVDDFSRTPPTLSDVDRSVEDGAVNGAGYSPPTARPPEFNGSEFFLGGGPQYTRSKCEAISGLCLSSDGEVSVSMECNNAEISFTSQGSFSVKVKNGHGVSISISE